MLQLFVSADVSFSRLDQYRNSLSRTKLVGDISSSSYRRSSVSRVGSALPSRDIP
jgi:hypothetical protein